MLINGRGWVDPLIEIAEICQYMKGWDWFTYERQPKFFLEAIKIKKRVEGEFANYQQKQWRRKQNLKQL